MCPVGLPRSAAAPSFHCSHGWVASNEDFCTPAPSLPFIHVITRQVTNSETLLSHLHMGKGECRGPAGPCGIIPGPHS